MKQIFLFLLCFSIFSPIICQTTEYSCGVAPPNTATSTNPNEIYFDRFGNSYDIPDLDQASSILAEIVNTNAGHFDLCFSLNTPADVQAVCVQAFEDISNIVMMRPPNICPDGIQELISIQIEWDESEELGGIYGYATPYFMNTGNGIDGCSATAQNIVFAKLNGMPTDGFNGYINTSFPGLFDGSMTLNATPADPYHTDVNSNPTIGTVDLYTVILHEMTHILGFASLANFTSFEEYSYWDQRLYTASSFNSDGTPLSVEPLIFSQNCSQNCWELNEELSEESLENTVVNHCLTSGDRKIYVGENILAPIYGGDGDMLSDNPDEAASQLANMMSHLHPTCDGMIDYLMQPELPNTLTEHRELTEIEINILCEMGYQTTICNGNPLVVVPETSVLRDLITFNDDTCCSQYYNSCVNEGLIINYSELLCNDSPLESIAITEVGTNSSDVIIIEDSNFFTITGLTLGEKEIYYTVTNDDCYSVNGKFYINITNCLDCETSNPCENLACLNDLENVSGDSPYLSNNGYFTELLYAYEESGGNSPDVCMSNGNQFLSIVWRTTTWNGSNTSESFIIPLLEPIEPGCNLNLQFDALSITTVFGSISSKMLIYGSEDLPCNITQNLLPFLECNTSVDCGDHTYSPICIGEEVISNTVSSSGVSCGSASQASDNFQLYNLDWNNITDDNVNYLIISATGSEPSTNVEIGYLYLDNFNATKTCLIPTTFTPIINCPEVQVSPDITYPGLVHNWNMGDDETIYTNNGVFNHTYTSTGTYVITHTVTDECGNSDIHTETIEIGCSLPSCVPPTDAIEIQENYTVTQAIADGLLLEQSLSYSNPQIVHISGTLTIDESYNFSPGSELYMDEGALILVENNAPQINPSLSLKGVYIHGCEKMWQGIHLGEKSEIFATETTIEDAEYAIKVNTGSWLHLRDVTFHKNLVGIYSPPYLEGSFYFNKFDNCDFNCTNATLLPAYYGQMSQVGEISYAGIEVNKNPASITIGVSGSTNSMKDISNGIIGISTDLDVFNMSFENITENEDYGLTGYGIYAKGNGESLKQRGFGQQSNFSFQKCTYGIYGQNMNLDIMDNRMLNMHRGIVSVIAQGRVLDILHNTIVTDMTGIGLIHTDQSEQVRVELNTITLENDSYAYAGIYIKGMGQGQQNLAGILNNTINVNTSGTGIIVNSATKVGLTSNIINIANGTQARGISISDLSKSKVACNVITGSNNFPHAGLRVINSTNNEYLGNDFFTLNVGARFEGVCTGTALKRNIFDNNQLSLSLSASAIFGGNSSDNTQFHHANIWRDNNVPSKATHAGNNLSVLGSQFVVHQEYDSSLTENFMPETIEIGGVEVPNGGNWFNLEVGTPDTDGQSDCALGQLVNLQITDLDKKLARDEVSVEIFNEEVKWEAKKSLYKKLDNTPSLSAGDADLQSFYSEKAGESMGNLTSVQKESETIHEIDFSIVGQLSSIKSQIENHRIQLRNLEALVSSDPTDEELHDLKIAKEPIYLAIEALAAEQKSLNTVIKTGKEVNAEGVKAQNTSIGVSAIYDANHKDVMQIYLSTVAKGNAELTSSQLSELWLVASQCPLSGGNAVFRARSMYSLYFPEINYDDASICNAGGIVLNIAPENNVATIEKTGDLSSVDIDIDKDTELIAWDIFPNPANHELNIVPSSLNENDVEIRFYDISGKSVHKSNLSSLGGKSTINTSSWDSGIYWCKFITNNSVIEIVKVTIIH